MNGLRGAGKDWHLQQNEVAMEDRLLYRVPEVAVILNISRSKVYELFSSGDLESVKIDRSRLVRSSDLRAYVDGLRPVDKSAWFVDHELTSHDLLSDVLRESVLVWDRRASISGEHQLIETIP
jgi:excisionase family DNA binding protein